MPIKSILIVEDDSILANDWKKVLEGSGYETVCVKSASEARAVCNTRNFDLFTLDLFYSENDEVKPDGGLRVIGWVRKHFKPEGVNSFSTLPIVAVTGYTPISGENLPALSAKALGADHVLTKPFPAEKLLSVVKNIDDSL